MNAVAEKNEPYAECSASERNQSKEFFDRSWSETSLTGEPRCGSILMRRVGSSDRIRMDFFNLAAPFQGSHFADYDAKTGSLSLLIDEKSYTVFGFALSSRKHVACRPDEPHTQPQGWDAEEEN